MGYVTKDKPGGCIFCDKPKAGDDRACHIVHRGESAYVMLNTYPYNNGHLLVAPFAHVAALEGSAECNARHPAGCPPGPSG